MWNLCKSSFADNIEAAVKRGVAPGMEDVMDRGENIVAVNDSDLKKHVQELLLKYN